MSTKDSSDQTYRNADPAPAGAVRPRWQWTMFALLVAVYGYGLTREINEPWVGWHDWNGAFFSQLARNFLRYPFDVHHGMPLVAAGRDVPPPDERSIYATHPPALVWLVAGAFQVFGESEWAARLVPIVFSLATFALLLWLIAAAYDDLTALLAGLFYAVMPMTVYYGRMVDHEAICLFCMVAATCGWVPARRRNAQNPTDRRMPFAWWAPIVAAIWLGVWVDWSMALFAGVFSAALVAAAIRGRIERHIVLPIVVGAGLAVVTMILFIVYAGLSGRFADLVAIFFSRSGEGAYVVQRPGTGDWSVHLVDNLSRGLLLFALLGVLSMGAMRRSLGSDNAKGNTSARYGLWLITITGVLWVALFWEQFLRHEYWMFYLGPAIAVAAGRGAAVVIQGAARTGAKMTIGAVGALALVTAAYEWNASELLYAAQHQRTEDIEDYRAVADAVPPGARLVMYRNPYRVERRGGYEFRNIVPPQLAWYIDRPITVARDPAAIERLAPTHAAFLIPREDAEEHHQELQNLFERYVTTVLQRQVLVRLDRPKSIERSPGATAP